MSIVDLYQKKRKKCHLRVSIFVNFVSSGKAGRTTLSFSATFIMIMLIVDELMMVINDYYDDHHQSHHLL